MLMIYTTYLLPFFLIVATNSNVIKVFWYKPHYQCGSDGSTPQNAAKFINDQLKSTDFVAISEWENHEKISIGKPEQYGSIGAICSYDPATKYIATPIVLFYNHRNWGLEYSYPPSSNCAMVPSLSGPNFDSSVCLDKVKPSQDNCCSCTYSNQEYSIGKDENQNLGQRPWVAGIFRRKRRRLSNLDKICVVAAELPHPLSNQTLWNLNGQSTSNTRQFSIVRNICTSRISTDDCIPNLDGTSIMFGTNIFVEEVSNFCGKLPIILMADMNIGAGDFPISSIFLTEPLHSMESVGPLVPYTCCNDTVSGGGLNRYGSYQILVSRDALQIDRLEGGSAAPGGALEDTMSYQCHANEEHAPLRAFISHKRKSSLNLRVSMMVKDAATALLLTKA
eukprot:CAMPEP_0178905908 /NCGR_PEP_ID=MMETSP0786-20121207/6537_1 /TAXON_ID=186022 /ORGANISM="Thalassionema frauenfeldii, Strain CCMP 1798" /LENGTH=391 /DNA_ID=CAMNT_0020577569 /DNA_START=62 /DNA_END=1234 /DNA_ORIENTATION=+